MIQFYNTIESIEERLKVLRGKAAKETDMFFLFGHSREIMELENKLKQMQNAN